VEIEFDPDKDRSNRDKHGISLAEAEKMDLAAAVVVPDERYRYRERRQRAFGLIDGRLYVLVFTMRGDVLRAISLRKANRREVSRYGQSAQIRRS
jgi:uncharacterized DUF497 family protein